MTSLVVGISCLCVGFMLGSITRATGDSPIREILPQQGSPSSDAQRTKAEMQPMPNFPSASTNSQAVLRQGARGSSSNSRDDLQTLMACANGVEQKAAEQCLQQLDAIGIQNPQVRGTFLQLLSAQQDPAAKARIFENITPAPLPPEDLTLFLNELEIIRQSSVPEVRADGLIRTAAWDHSETVAGVLRRGLYDESPEVVRAAATAVLASNVRTQELKEALLIQASDAAPDSELHRSALEALRDFPLGREEYEIYRAAFDRASMYSQK